MSAPPCILSLRETASCLFEISHVEVPKISWVDELEEKIPEERQWEQLDRDDGWLKACHQILSILENMEGNISYDSTIQKYEANRSEDDHWYVEFNNTTDTAWLTVTVTSWGEKIVLAEYKLNQRTGILHDGFIDGHPVEPVDLMFQVITEELNYLTSKTGSCTVALDYWQTECVPNPISQKEWADARGVGRQTVNDSVRAAKSAVFR